VANAWPVSPVRLLQDLIRIDTTNPPGHEAAAARYLADVLRRAEFPVTLLGTTPERQNLIARLSGRGEAPPILLQGHLDVVPADAARWTHPPFAAEIHDGVLWGRGALDDKGAIAVMTAALLRAKAEELTPPGDVLLVAVVDEEVSGEAGARYLVEEHPEHFADVRYGIGEGGGFAAYLAGRKVYPIRVAEKQHCQMRVQVRGRSGHGSVPLRGEAMARLGAVLRRLDRRRLPVHVTPTVRRMLDTVQAALPFPAGALLGLLRYPALTDLILNAMGERGEQIDPLLHNTVSPTVVRGGERINVIPGAVTLDLDGRLLPGFGPEDMLRELRTLLGADVEVSVLSYRPGPPAADLERYAVLADLIREADPAGTPFPHLLSGVTDARHFAKLGIQLYGFVPFDLPPGLIETVHGVDERVPVAAVEQGAAIMLEVLRRFRG
jgi:acetylornithine deacetylase/succinyl-diaminopimelate desuccinylase-like protein